MTDPETPQAAEPPKAALAQPAEAAPSPPNQGPSQTPDQGPSQTPDQGSNQAPNQVPSQPLSLAPPPAARDPLLPWLCGLGFLVLAGAIGFVWWSAQQPQPQSQPQSSADLQALQDRIARLEQRPGTGIAGPWPADCPCCGARATAGVRPGAAGGACRGAGEAGRHRRPAGCPGGCPVGRDVHPDRCAGRARPDCHRRPRPPAGHR